MPRGTPLFETVMAFENYTADPLLWGRHGDLEIDQPLMVERTNYPLAVTIAPGAELWIQALYDERRIGRAAVQRLLGHYRVLLEGIAADPEARVEEDRKSVV